MAVKNGNLVLLRYTTSSTIYCLAGTTSQGIEMSSDMIDVTTKDNSGTAAFVAGRRSGTMTVSGLYDPEATTGKGALDMFALLNAGTGLTVYWGEITTADYYFTASAYLTSFSIDAEKDGVSTWTANIQLTGAITTAVGSTTASTSTL